MIKIILLCLLAASCGYKTLPTKGVYFELGAGKNKTFSKNNKWEDGNGTGSYFSFRYEADVGVCHWTHLSQWDVGKPFNDKAELSVNHLGCAFRWKIM